MSITNDVISLAVREHGATRWAGPASFLTIALWLAVPPLLVFVAWWLGRPARAADGPPEVLGEGAAPALGEGGVPGAGEPRRRSKRVRPE